MDAWTYLADALWRPLAEFNEDELVAPLDLFSDLFAAAGERLSPKPTASELEETRNDPALGRSRFLALTGTDFASEAAVVDFLEECDSVIAEYELEGFLAFFRNLVASALTKFNLRYRLDDPFVLRFLLPGSFVTLYDELSRVNIRSADLSALWADFETAFDRFVRTQSDPDLRISISRASNYLEGLAGETRGHPDTLGKLCDQLTDWPHERVKAAVKDLYSFCSDYPGIRHAGTPKSRRRQLDTRDSVAINVALMALAAYLGSGMDHDAMLGMGPSRGGKLPAGSGRPASTVRRSRWNRFKSSLLRVAKS